MDEKLRDQLARTFGPEAVRQKKGQGGRGMAIAGLVLSGLWMWWEMKMTRRLGALALATGAGLFLLFVLII